MSDTETPIYASVQTAQKLAKMVNETPVEGTTVVDDMPKFLSDNLALRKWIYNLAIAALVIVGAWQTGQAIALESWENLFSVALNLGGVGAVSLARANVR